MRIPFAVMVCAMSAISAGGCARTDIGDRQSTAQSHLAQQGEFLAGAMGHLDRARARLGAETDPAKAGDEISAGYAQVQRADSLRREMGRDVSDLGGAAVSLQREIDSHRDDLLGPRGKRVRNRVLLVMVLAAIGWGLLELGPVFGGPVGGAVIVAGHVLTAFVVPLVGLEWKLIVAAWEWIVAALDRLATPKAGNSVAKVA
jgi:hypothetical protein